MSKSVDGYRIGCGGGTGGARGWPTRPTYRCRRDEGLAHEANVEVQMAEELVYETNIEVFMGKDLAAG